MLEVHLSRGRGLRGLSHIELTLSHYQLEVALLPVDLSHQRLQETCSLLRGGRQPLLSSGNPLECISIGDERKTCGALNQGALLLLLGAVEAALPTVVLGPAVLLAFCTSCAGSHIQDSGPHWLLARFLLMS
jgi:hypothetical protein